MLTTSTLIPVSGGRVARIAAAWSSALRKATAATLLPVFVLVAGGMAAAPASAHTERRPVGDALGGTRDFLSRREISTGAGTDPSSRPAEMSDEEFFRFSGVGAIVCFVNGERRMSTAFLVGAFDIAVTVAHPFEDDGAWAAPEDCVYNTTDSLGQIRERIPVASIKSQWQAQPEAFGQTATDLAVVRLSAPSRFAQRTMPLGKFSGSAAPALLIGFRGDMDADTLKRKSRGTVYERRTDGVAVSSPYGFTHDMDSRGIAAGAPVIDERSGVIIGIHTQPLPASVPGRKARSRNTMITMNDWLERTLRSEMQTRAEASD